MHTMGKGTKGRVVSDKRVNVVLPAGLLKKIDNWRRRQPELPSMSQAVRHLLEQAVERKES
jgi:metal-responsive CopG/Arc/MetJ family transcriptional regulator